MDRMPMGYLILESPTMTVDMKQVGRSPNTNRLIAEGTLQDADNTNRNGRDYDSADLFPALKDPRLTELMRAGSLKSEDGHPLDETLQRQQTIYNPLCCAKILSIWTDGKLIKGRFKGTNNDRGEYFNNDLLDGELPAWSLRALGTLQNKDGKVFVKNIRIITWDRVIYPSHKCAYTEKIVSESANLAGMGSNQVVYDPNWKGEIHPLITEDAIEYIRQESTNLRTFCDNFDTFGSPISLVENCSKVQITTANGSTARIGVERYIRDELMQFSTRR